MRDAKTAASWGDATVEMLDSVKVDLWADSMADLWVGQ